ncbi:MAG: hypothetical protein H7177_09195 [Rhizobacter sp.]|nr:hypothetical protein [Bacteriovorax sp.]
MANIRQSVETNKKLLIIIAVLLVFILTFLFKFYNNQKKENRALRLKLLSMSETKRTPKSWAQLMAVKAPVTTTANAQAAAQQPAAETNSNNPASTQATQNIDAQDTQELAVRLNGQMKKVKTLDEANIDNNIAIADEIISREPDSYGAYKAKLISLLTKEGKFNEPADDTEVEGLLENMAQFNLSTDNMARREAALISNTNGEIQNVESQLDALARQRETLESQLSTFDANSPQLADANAQLQQIEEQEAQLTSNIDTLEDNLAQNTAQISSEDVVEIPFMRMMAKNDYESVLDNAQSFINQFPNSPTGYFYMIRALDQMGQKDQSLNLIKNSQLPLDTQQALLQRLDTQAAEDPKNYWQKLSF